MTIEILGKRSVTEAEEVNSQITRSLARVISPEAGPALQDICLRAARAIDHAVEISRAISFGRRLVVSLDLCELVDAVEAEQEPLLRSGGRVRLGDRKVLVDVLASKRALDLVRSGHFLFTLLPGVGAEAIARVRSGYVHSARLKRSLESLPRTPRRQEGWLRSSSVERDHARREGWIRKDSAVLRETSRFVELLQSLLIKENYLSATRFERGFKIDPGNLRSLVAEISAQRRGESDQFADLVDAVNLLFASNSSQDEKFICHMTRTVTLHRLESGVWMRREADVATQGAGGLLPALIHPHVVSLLWLLRAEPEGGRNTYVRAESFRRFASQALSHIRTYSYFLESGRGFDELQEPLKELMNLRSRDRENAVPFSLFLNHILEDLLYAEQHVHAPRHERLLDRPRQVESLGRRAEEAPVALQQRRMLRVMEMLDRSSGVSSVEKLRGAREGISLAERAGFFVERREIAENAIEWRIFPEISEQGRERNAGLIAGVVFDSSGETFGINLFWPSSTGATGLITGVFRALAEMHFQSVAVLWEDSRGALLAIELSLEDRASACGQALACLGARPAAALQVISETVVATWESPRMGADGLTSLRFSPCSRPAARECYSLLGDDLPWELLEDLLNHGEEWRAHASSKSSASH